MQYFTSAAALTRTVLASALVASGIGAATPGAAGPVAVDQALVPATTDTSIYEERALVLANEPARQESTTTPIGVTAALTVELGTTVVYAETQEQVDEAIWALGRFDQARLDLPPLTVRLYSDRVECAGLNGKLAHAAGGDYVIYSCGVDFTLLHEMAHAWYLYSLDEATREAFLETAQANVWKNSEDWYLAGGEHAANVVAWALMETRINQTRTRPNDIESMYDGYELLTGGGIPLWSVSAASSGESKSEATAVPAVVADAAGASGASPMRVRGATPVEAEMIRWALQRFEVAGLELPPLAVSFHDDKAQCRGFVGYYSESDQSLDICTRAETSSRRRTVLHELGHAWSFANMTEGDVDEFVAHRGLQVWKDGGTPWWQMAQEQAAEIVAWGLQDADEYQSIWLQLEACSDLAASFELLTGVPPLHNNTQYCK
jgi:hypothetical protein